MLKYYKLILATIVLFSISCSFIKISEKKNEIGNIGKLEREDVVTLPIILLGDSHFNNIYTNPSLIRTSLIDKFAPATIRPAQLSLFSRDLFDELLDNLAKDRFVIHLGDAHDIGCTNEWHSFLESMNKASNKRENKILGWVMVPGNHDSTFYGNIDPKKCDSGEWELACSDEYINKKIKPGKPSRKNTFIENYLTAMNEQYNRDGILKLQPEKTIELKDASLARIYYEINKDKQFQSFIIQELNLNRIKNFSKEKKQIRVILIDTTDYDQRPTFIGGFFGSKLYWKIGILAGTQGRMSNKQIKIANEWIDEYDDENFDYFIIGHHPIEELKGEAASWIERKAKKDNFLAYISGHTHLGSINENEIPELKKKKYYEINLGSTIDWPIEVRTLGVWSKNVNDVDKKNYYSKLIPVNQATLNLIDKCREHQNFEWYNRGEKEPIAYTDYRKIKGFEKYQDMFDFTQNSILKTQVAMFYDMSKNICNEYKDIVLEISHEAKRLTHEKCNGQIPKKMGECRKKKFEHIKKMIEMDEKLRENAINRREERKKICFEENQKREKDQDKCFETDSINCDIRDYDSTRTHYGACQSLWASQSEYNLHH